MLPNKNQTLNIIKQAHNFDEEKVNESIALAKQYGWLTDTEIDKCLIKSKAKALENKLYQEEFEAAGKKKLDALRRNSKITLVIFTVIASLLVMFAVSNLSLIFMAIAFGFISSGLAYFKNMHNRYK